MTDQCDDCNCNEHQAPTGEYNYTDYAEKMEDLVFRYDKDFYPLDSDLPDPQVDPVILDYGLLIKSLPLMHHQSASNIRMVSSGRALKRM